MSDATGDGKESQPSTSSVQWSSEPCRVFEFPEIQSATDDFNESLIIGRGGFGKVYRGTIFSGSTYVVAAIKRLDPDSNQGASEFWAEVEMLSKLRHHHLVSLFGYCNHEKEMILVYEYMPNGTLEDHLHKLGTPLSWVQRLKICIGAGRGLKYLHTDTGIESGVIHRDVKSSNILLDESLLAKISDFGLSKIIPTNQSMSYVKTHVKGTFGYLDPDYFSTGRLTRRSDVYAFGVVLLELLCRKRAVDGSLDDDEWSLAAWAQDCIKAGKLKHIVDSDIRNQISPKCSKEFVRIACKCLNSRPKQRPTMSDVVGSLESVLISQEKYNLSLQNAGATIFGRLVVMFNFPSKGDNSAHGDVKQSSNIKGKSESAINIPQPHSNTFADESEVPEDCTTPNSSLKVFKFVDLHTSTKMFSQEMLLGEGGFAEVFLGWVDKNNFAPASPGVGMAVAVKRLHHEIFEEQAKSLEELSSSGQLSHPNIANLVGYCSKGPENYLVFEYLQDGTLDSLLFTNGSVITKVLPLSWGRRATIMIGVARGLVHLHSSKYHIIHCGGVRCSNIFLDQDFNPKLGGFDLTRPGSADSYIRDGMLHFNVTDHASMKSDMYSFGVVLMEVLTGKRHAYQNNMVPLASQVLAEKGDLEKIMDPCLKQNYSIEDAFEWLALAIKCLADNPDDRPSSEEVLGSLEKRDVHTVECKSLSEEEERLDD